VRGEHLTIKNKIDKQLRERVERTVFSELTNKKELVSHNTECLISPKETG
jgi:hypothetical protein